MTGEEMERAIEFLLQSQANADARMARIEAAQEQTQQQLGQTQRQLDHLSRVVESIAEQTQRNGEDIGVLSRIVNTLVEGRDGGTSRAG